MGRSRRIAFARDQSGTSAKPRAVPALAVTVLVAVALTACGGSGGGASSNNGSSGSLSQPGLFGKLPAKGTQTHGGSITLGQLNGNTPNYIFPVVPSGNASTINYQWQEMMWLPLYNNFPYGSSPGKIVDNLSLAKPAAFSNGNKTVTIQLKQGFKWSDGKPVDAQDLLFFVALVKAAVGESAANWTAFTPGYFPQSVQSIDATGPYTVVMHLTRPFNPGFFLHNQLANNVYLLPSRSWNVASASGPHLDWKVPGNAKKIYDYLNKAGGQVGTFTTNPLWKIADGPFVLSSFSSVNSSWAAKVNPSYAGSPKPSISSIHGVTYTGITPMLNAMRTGTLDVGSIDFSQLASVPGLRSQGYSAFGLPSFGWAGVIWNFKDTTNHFDKIISQLYFRQVMAMLVNQPAIVKGIYHSAAGLAYGPIPSVPKSPYVPPTAVNPPYPYNPAKAVAALKAHGWHVVPNGQTTCAKPGSGANQCGAGIPAGTPIKFDWYTQTAAAGPYVPLTDEAVTSEAKQVAGINVVLHQKTFNYIASNLNDADPSVAKYTNTWAAENFSGYVDNGYPTQNAIFNVGGSFNSGAYVDPHMDQLIKASVFGSDPNAVIKEADYEARMLPALFLPNYDLLWAVSKRVGGDPASYLSLTQYGLWPQYWWVNKK